MQLVRVTAAGVIAASKDGINVLCKATRDKEVVVCTAALTRLQQIAPSIHVLSPRQASRILAIATDSCNGAGVSGSPAAAAQALVVTWLTTECTVFARRGVSPAVAMAGRMGNCEALQRVVDMLKEHPEDEGLRTVTAALSLAVAVGTAYGGMHAHSHVPHQSLLLFLPKYTRRCTREAACRSTVACPK